MYLNNLIVVIITTTIYPILNPIFDGVGRDRPATLARSMTR